MTFTEVSKLPDAEFWHGLKVWIRETEPTMPRAYCICGQEMTIAEYEIFRRSEPVYCSLECGRRLYGGDKLFYSIGGKRV